MLFVLFPAIPIIANVVSSFKTLTVRGSLAVSLNLRLKSSILYFKL